MHKTLPCKCESLYPSVSKEYQSDGQFKTSILSDLTSGSSALNNAAKHLLVLQQLW